MKTTIISRTMRGTLAIAMALTTASALMSVKPALAATKDGDKINIVIDKRDMLDFNGTIQNDGTDKSDDLTAYNPVDGVEFTAYDITQLFYTQWDGTKEDADRLAKELTSTIKNQIKGMEPVATSDETSGGITHLELEKTSTYSYTTTGGEKKEQTVNAVYAIIETKSIESVTGSVPMIVGLDAESAAKDTLYLYPKNYGVDKKLTDINGQPVKDEEDVKQSLDVGDKLTYSAKFGLPYDLMEMIPDGEGTKPLYTYVQISDAMTDIGTTFDEITEIKLGTKSVTGSELTELLALGKLEKHEAGEKASWQLKFDMTDSAVRDAFADHAGDTIEIIYDVTVNEDFKFDNVVNNDVIVEIDRDGDIDTGTDDGTPITLGAIQIKKVDSKDKKPLPNAQFQLSKMVDGVQMYAIFTSKAHPNTPWLEASDVEWTADENHKDITKVTSDAAGLIKLVGLAHGDYILTEVEAPDGYVLLEKPIGITIDDSGKGVTIKTEEIENVPESPGSLPLTGGIGVITLLVIGGGMMGLSKMKKKEED